MKILQVMAGARYGGAEAFFTRLATALNKTDIDQRVIIRRDADRARLLRDGGVEPIELGFGGLLDFRTGMALRRRINEFKPYVVLSWMNRATSMCPRVKDGFHVGRLGGYYNLKYYRKCDHLIANTTDIADYLRNNGWPAEKVHYLPNFVGAKRVAPINRREFFTPEKAPLVLALGRLHENKAFDVLLNAIARVPNAYLWLAGEGDLRQKLDQQAEVLGIKPRVRFLGWREDTEALFAAADIFVCPSRHEPLGNVVIEAWAQGVPVVAADSLGPGTLINHGENGVLVPVDDANALARSLKRVVEDDDLRAELAQGGLETYEANHTEQIVVEKYLSFFESVARTKQDTDKD